MTQIKAFIALAFVGALLGTGYWFNGVLSERKELRTEKARLERELVVAAEVAQQANLARDVADARRIAAEKRSAEFNLLRETILRRKEDEPVPAALCHDLNRLFPGSCAGDGQGGSLGAKGTADPIDSGPTPSDRSE